MSPSVQGCIDIDRKDMQEKNYKTVGNNINTQQYAPRNYDCLDSFGTDIAYHQSSWGRGNCRAGR